jgi:hypothetical protein
MRHALTALGLYAGLCMPDQVCCTSIWVDGPADGSRPGHSQNVCGTLEQFERFARIACLQSKAVENPSTAIAIRLAGRCVAAKITADKIKNVQIIDERNHEEALKAQQQLREMGIPQ